MLQFKYEVRWQGAGGPEGPEGLGGITVTSSRTKAATSLQFSCSCLSHQHRMWQIGRYQKGTQFTLTVNIFITLQ